MYLVVKGFANSKISAAKGKIINLNKEEAASLLEAGYIVNAKTSNVSIREKDKIISSLEKTNETLVNRVAELEEENKKLVAKISELEILSMESTENVAEDDSNKEESIDNTKESTENVSDNDSNKNEEDTEIVGNEEENK